MRVLLTGASSFTGAWFARALLEEGVELILALARRPQLYDAERSTRLAPLLASKRVRTVEDAPFGSARFIELCRALGPLDVLALHGAVVGDHRARDFPVREAVRTNTFRLERVLERAARSGCRAIVVTGSVFEAGEGGGGDRARPVNPYGLAKTLTWRRFARKAPAYGFTLGKFTIPAPFGPGEKPNLPRALMEAWLRDAVPHVRHPHLVRDHVPVDALARAYARFVLELSHRKGVLYRRPSGFAEPIGSFARRLGAAMRPRLARPCRVNLADPPLPSPEPAVRINDEPLEALVPEADPERFFDAYAAFYRNRAKGPRSVFGRAA